MKLKKLLIPMIAIAAFIVVRKMGWDQYLTLEYVQANLDSFKEYYAANQVQTIGIFAGIYITATALSIPGATILTLTAGALFGLTTGVIIVSFASTIGATLAFLASRYVLRDSIQNKYGDKLKSINEGVEKSGASYLFTLRLLPIFPFFLINLLMGLTPMRTLTYFFVSQIGMLPGTAVYVNAGSQLSQLKSLKGILSPQLLVSFALLGLFPLIVQKIVGYFKARKVYAKYKKPEKFDYNMVSIGAGAAGLVTSYIGAAVKAKVALIEKHKMGGDCLNTGCVPSKAILRSAKINHYAKKAEQFGFTKIDTDYNFSKVMDRVHEVIAKIEPHDSVERYTKLGVECIQGTAQIISPWEVKVGDRILTTKNITIATGARPFVPPIPGLDEVPYLISDTLWDIKELPKKFLVIGGGPIGLEMAQAFQRLGSQVTIVEMGPRVMAKEDEDVAIEVQNKLRSEGIDVQTETKLEKFEKRGDKNIAHLSSGEVEFDKVLLAIGRRPNTSGFGLEELGIELNRNGTIQVNEYLQTKYPNIYACGDVAGPYQLTHIAAHQAWYCAVNGLFGKFKKFKVDYSVVPWATYTDPEVATVGHTENSAKDAGIEFDITKYGLDDLDRAIADSEDYGFVKVLTQKGTDKIIGATIVGTQASTMIIEFVTAMKYKIGLNKILGTIHAYPSMGEGNKYAAGEWKRKQTSEKVFNWLNKFHTWSRS